MPLSLVLSLPELLAEIWLHIQRDLRGIICPVCDTGLYFPNAHMVACVRCDPSYNDED